MRAALVALIAATCLAGCGGDDRQSPALAVSTGASTTTDTDVAPNAFAVPDTGAVPAVPAGSPLRFAYAANYFDGTVSMYTADAGTGQLRHNGYIVTNATPSSVVVAPTGDFAYVTSAASSSISTYAIDPETGRFTRSGLDAATGTTPQTPVFHPSQKILYVANTGSNTLTAFRMDAVSGVPVVAGTTATKASPSSIAIEPAGRFAFVTNTADNSISTFSVDAKTGMLSLLATTTTALGPVGITVDSAGKFAYAVSRSGTITVYGIDETGTLMQRSVTPFIPRAGVPMWRIPHWAPSRHTP
jgi:6-phosphogluconolactonase